MRTHVLPIMLTIGLGQTACVGDDLMSEDTSMTSTSTTSTSTTSTSTGPDVVPEDGSALPEGLSSWSGEAELNGAKVLLEASITNTAGDLAVVATVKDHPDASFGLGTGEYTLTGTHEPTSGGIALSPVDWTIRPDLDIELVGISASYNPETQQINGLLVDYAAGTDNELAGGPVTLEIVDGDGTPTVPGDEAAALAEGSQTFLGTLKCTGAPREAEATLVYNGAGGLSGSIKIGDPELTTPLGTYAVSGVHNPSTGGITLVPGLWENTDHNTLTFFVDGVPDHSERGV